MSFAEELNFGRDAYTKFKRDEIMTGFNLSVEGMKFTFHCGKMDTATGLVLSHDPISHKAIVQFEAKPHLQEVDVYGLHKDGKIVLLGKCSGTDPLYTAEAREHIAAGEKRRFAASVAIATMHDEAPEYEIVEYMKTKKARTSRRSVDEHHLTCPITLQLMKDPVLADDGIFYERWAIEAYMRNYGLGQLRSPVTRQTMRGTLNKSHGMKAMIDEWRAHK